MQFLERLKALKEKSGLTSAEIAEKKHITKLLLVAFCVILTFGFCSCETDVQNCSETGSFVVDNNNPFTFESVDELKIAVKKEPKSYNNRQVTVTGTVIVYEERILLVDFSGTDFGGIERYEAKKNSITIIIPDDVLYSVLETGDYIEINGTVAISDGKTYLDNCRYTMITTCEERQ